MRGRFQMDVRLVGAGMLAAVTALVVLMVTSPPERTSIVVAGSDLPAGVSLGELDLVTPDAKSSDGFGIGRLPIDSFRKSAPDLHRDRAVTPEY